MPGYFIYVKGDEGQGRSRCNPIYSQGSKTTVYRSSGERQREYNHHRITPTKAAAMTIATASKVNSYVGEYTNNMVLARKRGVFLTGAGLVATALTWNPVTAGIAAGILIGDKIISYEIEKNKQAVSAEYLRKLSGGTVKTR